MAPFCQSFGETWQQLTHPYDSTISPKLAQSESRLLPFNLTQTFLASANKVGPPFPIQPQHSNPLRPIPPPETSIVTWISLRSGLDSASSRDAAPEGIKTNEMVLGPLYQAMHMWLLSPRTALR
ncbi:uncharacterized protein VTP21DRAFT_2827 [Calcarisporiella thermophila]|uniref:uncharacterized protein n=1 Tax=Calcarisporiella thermophila TaxID=911321 RepID=UPI00374212DE